MNQTIGIIGAGNMGQAITLSLIKLLPHEKVLVCDRDKEKLTSLGVKNTSTDVNKIVQQSSIIILAVKPQSFDQLCQETESFENKLVVSIMAGVSIEKIRQKTNALKIVRAMPNLALKIRRAVTGWIASQEVTIFEKEYIKKIIRSFGDEIELETEDMINAITALSGSGPAYFFYLCELLGQKAEEFGFQEEDARKIAENTFIGAAHLLESGQDSAKTWREAVTSKGGTTEAALLYMQENKVDTLFSTALEKAMQRAKELNT